MSTTPRATRTTIQRVNHPLLWKRSTIQSIYTAKNHDKQNRFQCLNQENPLESNNMESSQQTTSLSSSSPTPAWTTSNHATSTKIYHVLVLHGKGSNAHQYKETLQPLIHELHQNSLRNNLPLQFEFDCITAPFPVPTNTVTRTELGRQWWSLPNGVRSFEALEYIGLEKSVALVQEALSQTHRTYDLLLGHSQGAILLAILMRMNMHWFSNTEREDLSSVPPVLYKPPKAFLLNGVAWPNPFRDLFTNPYPPPPSCPHENGKGGDARDPVATTHPNQSLSKALFIIGEQDRINPPEGAKRVRDVFLNMGILHVDTWTHSGGHSLPIQDPASLDYIVDWIFENAIQEKWMQK